MPHHLKARVIGEVSQPKDRDTAYFYSLLKEIQ
jgi:hypothetical protein